MGRPNRNGFKSVSLIVAVLAFSPCARATNGYFAHGFGVQSQGVAGVGIALPQDALAASTNPAGTAFVGDRADAGLTWFEPKRGAVIVGNGFGADGKYDGNGTSDFFIPEFGIARQSARNLAWGVSVYGNGGMNTEYSKNPYAAFGGVGKAGVDLSQLFVTPSLAYKLAPRNALGLGINLAYQKFAATGVQPFAGSSVASGSLTNQGHDSSFGVGVRLGWTGEVVKNLTVGLTWASKVSTGKFEKYKGLFADGGSFDIPENYGLGIAYAVSPQWTFASDVQRIKYGSIPSIANPLAKLFAGNALGSSNGPGFGWQDVTVEKFGATYAVRNNLLLRAGYSHSDQPIPADQTFFNILAPGVVQDHLSIGATWGIGRGDLSFAYTHGFKTDVKGANSIPAAFGGGNANVHLEEEILGLAYAWKF